MSESLPNVREAPERPPAPDSPAAQAAAAAVADDFIDQGVPVANPDDETRAAAALRELEDAGSASATEEKPPLPEPDPLDESTPPGYEFLDEEFDDEPETEAEPAVAGDEDEFYVDEEDDAARLKAQLRKAERKAEHERELRVRGERKNWRQEALRVFPYSKHKVDTIQSTSRRDFLRQAQALHKEAIGLLREYANVPAAEEVAREVEGIRQEAKADAARRYGPPTAGPPGNAVTQAEAEREYQEARAEAARTGNLGKLFSKMAQLGR